MFLFLNNPNEAFIIYFLQNEKRVRLDPTTAYNLALTITSGDKQAEFKLINLQQ